MRLDRRAAESSPFAINLVLRFRYHTTTVAVQPGHRRWSLPGSVDDTWKVLDTDTDAAGYVTECVDVCTTVPLRCFKRYHPFEVNWVHGSFSPGDVAVSSKKNPD